MSKNLPELTKRVEGALQAIGPCTLSDIKEHLEAVSLAEECLISGSLCLLIRQGSVDIMADGRYVYVTTSVLSGSQKKGRTR